MGATGLVLGSAILGLFCTSFPKGAMTIPTNRCDAPPPCTCDDHGRVTCDCKDEGKELIITPESEKWLTPRTSLISVSNCRSVYLTNSSLIHLEALRLVELVNVANLTLERQSFELSPRCTDVKITVRNSSIDLLSSFTFRGDIKTIMFMDVRIGLMSSFAFANLLNTDTIRLEDCNIENIEAHAFKKFDVQILHVIRGSFRGIIPSRTMNDIEVYQSFMLDGVKMETLRSLAFIVKKPKTVAIQNCIFDSVEGEAFDISVRGPVIMKNNTFANLAMGAFLEMKADMENRSRGTSLGSLYDLIFKNNTLKTFEEGSLIFDRSSFRPEIDNLLVDQTCDCDQLSNWKSDILNYTNVYSRLNTKQDEMSSAKSEPIGSEIFLCINGANNSPITFTDYETRNCALSNSLIILIVAAVGVIILLLISVCLIIWCCRKRRQTNRKSWISVPTSAPDVVSKKNGVISKEGSGSSAPVDSRITMVVPDGRLYRETEFHVIVEKTEPLTTEL
ncbi:uncharacterized protein LOC127288540 [Leptopilina boulardi]|uniref:uncharacterized protein LOC127288540 n=1 Tax=Leptopilina boulardi TaxID=63433 RepID=UPI0021F50A40|nr:uncharacterized protein LOC127288540 [Leptopilina boulardi]XP_051172005.1 uncharacterized protein LOC127288540 [Leptopilina boulardi]XP_051172006.1 uncharacterized protein LOC127288540 [Leptopilina boulardi]XP_051172007.1 uncharacterized protein LOC127288540 [Leptopilina boulardi]